MPVQVIPAHMFTYDGAAVNVYHADLGQGLPKHSHAYSHACVCHAGSIVVRKEGKELTMDKFSQPLNLVAGEWHEIEALEDNTVFENIFAQEFMQQQLSN